MLYTFFHVSYVYSGLKYTGVLWVVKQDVLNIKPHYPGVEHIVVIEFQDGEDISEFITEGYPNS